MRIYNTGATLARRTNETGFGLYSRRVSGAARIASRYQENIKNSFGVGRWGSMTDSQANRKFSKSVYAGLSNG